MNLEQTIQKENYIFIKFLRKLLTSQKYEPIYWKVYLIIFMNYYL